MSKIYISSFIDDYGQFKYGLAYYWNGKEYYLKEHGRELIYSDMEDAVNKMNVYLKIREREDHAVPMTVEEAKSFVGYFNWRFATSYANTAPHEYLIKEKLVYDNQLLFERFVALIKRDCEEGYFYSNKNKYYILGNHYYWLSGYDNMPVDLINRAKVSQLQIKDGKLYYGGNK